MGNFGHLAFSVVRQWCRIKEVGLCQVWDEWETFKKSVYDTNRHESGPRTKILGGQTDHIFDSFSRTKNKIKKFNVLDFSFFFFSFLE